MIKKWHSSLLLFATLIFCSSLKAQNKAGSFTDTTTTHEHYLKPAALIIPGSFLLYSALKPAVTGIRNIDDTIFQTQLRNHPGFHTNAADYIMWAPSASVYVLDALKVKTKHNFKEHLILDAGSIIITGGLGYAMRLVTRNVKEYNTYNTDFPSGHTANAFRGAEILHQESKHTNPLLSYTGYLAATTVGVLRICNTDHLLTQVLVGAGLGILSTKITYFIFDKIKYRKKKIPY